MGRNKGDAERLRLTRRIRYACEAVIVGCVSTLLRLLPLPWASAVGGCLGRLAGTVAPRSGVARRNLAQAMPGKDAASVAGVIDAMWDNLGRALAEIPRIGRMACLEFQSLVAIEGVEAVGQHIASGRPCIFFSAHLANWEIAPKTLAALGHPLALVYRQGNNPALDRVMQRIRRDYQTFSIAKGDAGARQLLRAIQQRVPIGMLVDQKMNDGIPVEFFGRPAMTAPAIAQVALKYDCLLIPVRVVRTGGPRHRVTILPPLPIERTGNRERDVAAIMLSINRLLEGWIREHPGQWLWLHRRWPGESRDKHSGR